MAVPDRASENRATARDVSPENTGEPRMVAGHRLLRRIGEGGMSTVYLGYDLAGNRPVAIKLLSENLARQKEFVHRFYREGSLSQELVHPQIVHAFDSGYDTAINRHYLVLEFVDGPSTHAVLGHLGRVPLGITIRIASDIARALAYLHANGYVHRDVKPDNILLHPEGSAKLADLGLAKLIDNSSHLTSLSHGVGTSYYMPYEQALNSSLVDGRSDVFALGATLYHLLTGRVPFAGSTHEEIIRLKSRDSFHPARFVHPDIPLAVDAIVSTCLALDPRVRYQSASQLADELEATRLATPIPSFVWDHLSSPGQHTLEDPSGPKTKTDLKVFDPPVPDPNRLTDLLLLPPASPEACAASVSR